MNPNISSPQFSEARQRADYIKSVRQGIAEHFNISPEEAHQYIVGGHDSGGVHEDFNRGMPVRTSVYNHLMS